MLRDVEAFAQEDHNSPPPVELTISNAYKIDCTLCNNPKNSPILSPKKAMSISGTLPQDIVADILSRLPVESLCRFKCVSHSWNSLISDPRFAKTHLNRIKTQDPKYLNRKLLIISGYDNLYSLDLAEVNPTATKLDFPTMEQHAAGKAVKVLSSYDGLLLVSRHRSSTFLLNPSTRECKKLPFIESFVCPTHSNLYGLGYDSSADDYKILMLSSYNAQLQSSTPRYVTNVAVYSLKTNAWRRIQDTNYYSWHNSGGVFVNGCIHGICERDRSMVIVAFDLSDEIFREVPLPALFNSSRMIFYRVAVLGGCLCLVDAGTDVWMMREYGVRESWTKFWIPSGMSIIDVVCLSEEEEYLLKTNGSMQLFVYNPQKDTKRNIVVCGIGHISTFVGTYVDSLVSPHLGGLGDNE